MEKIKMNVNDVKTASEIIMDTVINELCSFKETNLFELSVFNDKTDLTEKVVMDKYCKEDFIMIYEAYKSVGSSETLEEAFIKAITRNLSSIILYDIWVNNENVGLIEKMKKDELTIKLVGLEKIDANNIEGILDFIYNSHTVENKEDSVFLVSRDVFKNYSKTESTKYKLSMDWNLPSNTIILSENKNKFNISISENNDFEFSVSDNEYQHTYKFGLDVELVPNIKSVLYTLSNK